MDLKDIAARMRSGSARYWPDERHQCKGFWFDTIDDIQAQCFAQMLQSSLCCNVRDEAFMIAAAAVVQAAGIEMDSRVHLRDYIVALNEGHILNDNKVYNARPFAELKRLIEVAADLLDGGELPAEGQPAQDESLPQSEPPVDIPGPNPDPANVPTWDAPSEQPTPLPTAITNLLMVNPPAVIEVREKEYA